MNKTTDYSIFKKMLGNRDIDEGNLKKIVTSIKMSNLLEFRPLLVSENMEVIDGQHRLQAAKQLKLEVYYTIREGAVHKDMHILNSAQKQWSLDDYMNFYARQGDRDFVRIQDFCRENEIGINEFIYMIGKHNGRVTNDIKKGNLPFASLGDLLIDAKIKLDFVISVKTFIQEMSLGDKKYLTSKLMRRSLAYLVNIEGFDKELFIQKLKYNLSRIHPCRNMQEYSEMFKSFYNYRNQNPLP